MTIIPSEFQRVAGKLTVEGHNLSALAQQYGTPLYIYSGKSFRSRFHYIYDSFVAELSPLEPMIAYSVKACSSLAILALLAKEGSAFDVVSGGELLRVIHAGGDAKKVIFAGVGKTDDELRLALETDVLQINVESRGELLRLQNIAKSLGKIARVAVRVNPEVQVNTHKHLATGSKTSKFGIPIDAARELLSNHQQFDSIQFAGLHIHVGSMLDAPDPYLQALDRIETLISLFPNGKMLTIDVGGGFAVEREGKPGLDPKVFVRAIATKLKAWGAAPIFEPGRWISAPSGILVTRVLDCKYLDGREIVVVDAAMNDLIRPALYDAVHPIEFVESKDSATPQKDTIPTTVVGPICESGDFLSRDAKLINPTPGDLLAILAAGAYGFSMASNYNTRGRAAELLADGGAVRLIRRRETFDDLIANEFVS
ncbi:MAG: diaminopimelate decarboxylase [Planctomycetota bacterium]